MKRWEWKTGIKFEGHSWFKEQREKSTKKVSQWYEGEKRWVNREVISGNRRHTPCSSVLKRYNSCHSLSDPSTLPWQICLVGIKGGISVCKEIVEWKKEKLMQLHKLCDLSQFGLRFTPLLLFLWLDEFPPQLLQTPAGLFELWMSGREETLSQLSMMSAFLGGSVSIAIYWKETTEAVMLHVRNTAEINCIHWSYILMFAWLRIIVTCRIFWTQKIKAGALINYKTWHISSDF